MAASEQSPFPPSDEPSRSRLRRPLSAAMLVVAIAALAGGTIAHFIWPPTSPSTRSAASAAPSQNAAGNSGSAPSGSAAAQSTTTASLAARVSPGLVDINTVTGQGAAAGTGMVVTSSGEVITNNHVIAGATRITATDVGNGKTYTARVLGYDRKHDVAVLMLSGASGLTTVPLGDSTSVRVGAMVVAVGNAGGVGGTPSASPGSVAALDQAITAGDAVDNTFERLTGLIHVNGQLQPGDSGGPLVDSSGKVVGMDTAASSNFSFQSSSGDGFAIPINKVLAIAKNIVAGQGSKSIHIGGSAGALLGVYVESTSVAGGTANAGAAVGGVIDGTPAASAGLTFGDTITALDGQTVTSPTALTALMARHRAGDRVRLTWIDQSGTSHTATLRLTAAPPA
jgi:S1-C subfamily serine protease